MSFTVVFVGSGNIGRTALAAALLGRELRAQWPKSAAEVQIVSTGVDVAEGMPVAPHLETVAARRGLDVSEHRAAPFVRETADGADLVLTMTRKQRAQIVLQYPHLRPRSFALLEFLALLENAATVRRRQPIGRGDRLEAKLRLVVTATGARQRVLPVPSDERQWDLFDPYAYSLDVYETVAAMLEAAMRSFVSDVAVVTGSKGEAAYRTA